MFVSILQLMGFPLRVNTPAPIGENSQVHLHGTDNRGITRTHESHSTDPGKPAATTSRRAVPVAAVSAEGTGMKTVPKVVAKAGKSHSRPESEAKATPAAGVLPPAKKMPGGRPAAHLKPQDQVSVKASVKPVKAASVLPASPRAAQKKPAAFKDTVAKAGAGAADTASAKAASAKSASAKPAQPTSKKAPPLPKNSTLEPKAATDKVKPVAVAKLAPLVEAAAPSSLRAMPPRPDQATVSASPARATRPSARLAQITVPSMAQSVASTAAKASYTQLAAPAVLTPPPLVAVKKDPKLANNWKTKAGDQLSDAEVMAMPEVEYMNDKQMAFFRGKLAQLRLEILNSASETTEHLREDTVIVPDPTDRATIEEEHALELRTRDRERKLLKKIEQSIGRIDAGDYGYCDETGEPIGVGRLLARPTAMLSLEAQQRRELKQNMFGD